MATTRFSGQMPLMQQAVSKIALVPDLEHVASVTMDGNKTIDGTDRFPDYKNKSAHRIEKGDILFTVTDDRHSTTKPKGPVRASLNGMDLAGLDTPADVEAAINVIGVAETPIDFEDPVQFGLTGLVQGTGTWAQNPVGRPLARGDIVCWKCPNFRKINGQVIVEREEYTQSEEWFSKNGGYANKNRKVQLGRRRVNGIKDKLTLKLEVYSPSSEDRRVMEHLYTKGESGKLRPVLDDIEGYVFHLLKNAFDLGTDGQKYNDADEYLNAEWTTIVSELRRKEFKALETHAECINYYRRRVMFMILQPATIEGQVDFLILNA